MSFVIDGYVSTEAINHLLVVAGILVFMSGKEFVEGMLVVPPVMPLVSLTLELVD